VQSAQQLSKPAEEDLGTSIDALRRRDVCDVWHSIDTADAELGKLESETMETHESLAIVMDAIMNLREEVDSLKKKVLTDDASPTPPNKATRRFEAVNLLFQVTSDHQMWLQAAT
jgi:hypothetical protein